MSIPNSDIITNSSPRATSVLTVDQGNTAIKLDLWSKTAGGEWSHTDRMTARPDDADRIFEWVESRRPGGAIYCSVGHLDVRLIESLRCLLSDRMLVLTHSTPLPIRIDYATPDTLGSDRVAAACGAALLMPDRDCVIADAGTALTLDLLTAGEIFAGGRISPGLNLRFRSLHDHTSRLPLLSTADLTPGSITAEVPTTGYDTPTSILSGVIRGMAVEIASSTHTLTRSRKGAILLLTGGDAPLLAPFVRSMMPHPETLMLCPLLMSRGLLSIYLYNEDNLNDDNV